MAYVETMGRTVFALFRAYHAQLQKLVLEVANKVSIRREAQSKQLGPDVYEMGY